MQAEGESPLSPQRRVAESPASPQRPSKGSQASKKRHRRHRPTARNLKSLPVGEYTDAVVAGLTLRVKPTGRFWFLRYRPKRGPGRGPQRRLALGQVGGPPTIDLEALGLADDFGGVPLGLEGARDLARALQGLAATGRDPLVLLEAADRARREREEEEARRQSLGLETLGDLVDRFIALRADPPPGSRERRIRPATLKGWQSLRRGALAELEDRDPAALTVEDVSDWHERVGEERGRVAANRALELLRAVYTWAMKERVAGRPLLNTSPCAGVEAFEEEPRQRGLSSEELRAVWQALKGEPYADTLHLLLWTGARKSEVLRAEWSEIDFSAALWTVPAARSKTGRVRRIPLSTPALLALRRRRDADLKGRWLFPSPVDHVGAIGSLQALLRRVRRRSGVTGWTLHDFRRVVRTELSSLGVRRPVAEYVLGHLPPKIQRTYDLHEPIAEARAALESWARRLESYVSPEDEGAEVVPFTAERE